MVVGVFPIAKLGSLLLRQVSKPIANFAKERAKQSLFFRTYICMPPAQFYNWCEVRFKMWMLNLGKPDAVPRLNEEMAIELGANLLGEGIIFVIAAGVIYAEYARSVRKEAAKEAERREEMDTLYYTIRELGFKVESQEAEIRHLMNMVANLDSRVMKFPWKPFSKPVEEQPPLQKENPNNTKGFGSSVNPDSTKSSGLSEKVGIVGAVDYVSKELLTKTNGRSR